MIEINNLRKSFGDFVAVDDISFKVAKGEVLGFLGPNGAGKSTTMKMATGFLSPDTGSATICGHSMADDAIAAKKELGYLPEGAPAYADMTPASFLEFIADMRGLEGQQRSDAIKNAVEKTHLQEVFHKPIDNLSKGFKRRVGLAQAILHNPPVLIMDEPTDGLDPNQKHEVRQLIKEMSKDKAIIISTHILEEVDAICSRAMIISHGKVLFDGSPQELQAKAKYHNSIEIGFNKDDIPSDVDALLAAVVGMKEVTKTDTAELRVFTIHFDDGHNAIPELSKLIVENNWQPVRFDQVQGHLDDVFRELTLQEEHRS